MRWLTATLIVTTSLLALGPAGARASTKVRKCQAADLRYPFRPGVAKFGVLRLRITGGGCATAHRVAKDWMSRFEASFRRGQVRLPKSVDGFSFTTLPVHAAQTFSEQGRKPRMTIRFHYTVPNG